MSKLGEKRLHPVALVLDNIRSAYNVGSIFRTAETALIQEVGGGSDGLIACRPRAPLCLSRRRTGGWKTGG
jgi:hypothetical protein